MQLFHSPTTPFGRKVMVTILETGLADKVQVVDVMGTPLNPGTMPIGHNPLGKIPALLLDDGSVIYDSRVICRYLDDLAGAGLYPAAPKLWQTLTLEATADGILEAALSMVYEVRIRPTDKQFPDWIEGQWSKASRALDAVESNWMPHLNGPLDMAHIAIACALSYLDFRLDARAWRATRPNLAKWEAEFSTRPSMQNTQPPVV
jgi:glutathione S-transferase